MRSGWAWPQAAQKCHAYDLDTDGSTSLCGKWWYPIVGREGFQWDAPLDAAPSKSDCAACHKKLERRAKMAHHQKQSDPGMT